jgi:hypothetical protein
LERSHDNISYPRRNAMQKNIRRFTALALLAGPLACYADSSYEHTSQMTGGQLVDTLKNFAVISKQMKQMTAPMSEITMVHGNQKAIVSKDYTEIWDLDKEVIIHIDTPKKSYSVTTFADMRKMIQEMPAKMAEMQQQLKDEQAKMKQQQGQQPTIPPNLQFTPSVDVKDTGLTKMIEKYNAKQQILTMKMVVTDTNNPQTNITYSFTDEIWTTPDLPAEMKEVQDFDRRFGEKLMQGMDVKDLMGSMANMRNGSGMGLMQMFGSKPGAADAFAQMQKEMAKITGTKLLEITRMGGSGTGMEAQPGTPGAPATAGASGSTGSSVAGQAASGAASSAASTTASTAAGKVGGIGGSAIGGALSGALGGMFHKKAAAPPAQPAAATTPAAGSAPAAAAPTDVTLMEQTTNTHDFSTETIPSSVFQIPAGYKQVESGMQQMMDKK